MPNRTTNLMDVLNFVKSHKDTYPLISPSKANLSGKSMFITGASKGIGRSTAIRYAMAGCSKIAIGARSSIADVETEIKAAASKAGHPEPQVVMLKLDVTSGDSVREAAEFLESAFGGSLDVLITNAGYLETWKNIAESDPEEWWRTWEVNIKGTYLCARYFIPMLLKSETKLLLTLSSMGGQSVRNGASSYQTSKFATCRLTEFADQEYNDQGLVAIAVHPGGVQTELALKMPDAMHALLQDTVELSGDSMVWLANERREWLAGRYICVNWDVKELEARKDEIVEKDLLKFRLKV